MVLYILLIYKGKIIPEIYTLFPSKHIYTLLLGNFEKKRKTEGFNGFMSNIRYFDHYLPYAKIRNHINRGPSSMPCVDSKDKPPYFDLTWWTNN